MTGQEGGFVLLTPEQTATVLGISEKTLAGWRSAKRGPDYAKIGSLVRYRDRDLDSWLEDSIRRPEESAVTHQGRDVALPVQGKRNHLRQNNRLGGHKKKRERRSQSRSESKGVGDPGAIGRTEDEAPTIQ